jgi:hypothetical protein
MEQKYHLRIPTEQYAYIECEFIGSASEAIEHYYELKGILSTEGVLVKEFNACLDDILKNGQTDDFVEKWEKMSPAQKSVFSEIKKSLARINR